MIRPRFIRLLRFTSRTVELIDKTLSLSLAALANVTVLFKIFAFDDIFAESNSNRAKTHLFDVLYLSDCCSSEFAFNLSDSFTNETKESPKLKTQSFFSVVKYRCWRRANSQKGFSFTPSQNLKLPPLFT